VTVYLYLECFNGLFRDMKGNRKSEESATGAIPDPTPPEETKRELTDDFYYSPSDLISENGESGLPLDYCGPQCVAV
jgi:hypothetical protein